MKPQNMTLQILIPPIMRHQTLRPRFLNRQILRHCPPVLTPRLSVIQAQGLPVSEIPSDSDLRGPKMLYSGTPKPCTPSFYNPQVLIGSLPSPVPLGPLPEAASAEA